KRLLTIMGIAATCGPVCNLTGLEGSSFTSCEAVAVAGTAGAVLRLGWGNGFVPMPLLIGIWDIDPCAVMDGMAVGFDGLSVLPELPICMPFMLDMSMPFMSDISIPFMPDIFMPMSIMVRLGRGSMGGMAAARPRCDVSVPRAKPVRSSAWAKI